MLGTSKTASVCIGDQLTLTCSTNGTSLEWSVPNPHMDTRVGMRQLTSTGRERLGPFVTSQGVFTFSRTSLSPLITVLDIVNTTAILESTTVSCERTEGMSTTVINAIENGNLKT